MNKILVLVLASVAALTLPVTASFAAEASANVALTSNYVDRGFTLSNDGLAVQAAYDIKQSKDDTGWYAGAFTSTVDGGAGKGTALEVDLTAGWKGVFTKKNNIGYDIGAVLYKFTDSKVYPDVNEFYAGVNYESAYVKLFLGNESGGSSYSYLDVGASFVFSKDIDLALHYGHLSTPSISDISASLSKDISGINLDLSLTYQDSTTKDNLEFFVTVKKEFDL